MRAAALLSLLLGACTPHVAETGAADDPFALELERSEVVTTVLTARWTAPGAEESWVEYGEGALDLVAPGLPDGQGGFEIALLGLHTEVEVQARAVARVGGERVEGALHTAVTGPLPPELPPLALQRVEAGHTEAGWLVAKVGAPPTVALLDMQGRYLWWYEVPRPFQFARAVLSRDHRSVVYLGWEGSSETTALVERVSLQGEVLTTTVVPYAHHDFAELPDGTLAVLVKDLIDVDGEEVKGEKIVEIAPDGSQTEAWSLWDHQDYDPEFVPGAPGDWAHANAMDYDPDLDAWIVSFKNFHSIWRIDRPTGEVDWKFGGRQSTFADAGGGTDFATLQHQFQVLDDGMLVFDNGDASVLDSRVVEYAVDWSGGLVEERWVYHNDPVLYCFALGDASRLPDGNTLVTWSAQGQLDQVSPTGQVLWRLTGDLGAAFGYTTWRDSLYDPP